MEYRYGYFPVSSHSFHHPQEVLLVQSSLYVHKGGIKPHSFIQNLIQSDLGHKASHDIESLREEETYAPLKPEYLEREASPSSDVTGGSTGRYTRHIYE